MDAAPEWNMKYFLPDEITLAKYLAMLRDVIVEARFRAYEHDKQTAELLDAVENVPDLLCRWPDMNESIVLGELEAYEAKYCNGVDRFSGILKRGPKPDWQLVWQSKDKSE
jgi:hypothetical protein